MVIHDWCGNVLATGARIWNSRWLVDMAGARAVLYGLHMAKNLNYSHMIMESDAINICNSIYKTIVGAATTFLIFDEIILLKSSFNALNGVMIERWVIVSSTQ